MLMPLRQPLLLSRRPTDNLFLTNRQQQRRSPAFTCQLRPALHLQQLASRPSVFTCASESSSTSGEANGQDSSPAPAGYPTPAASCSWDKHRGFGWLKFLALWGLGVALALAMPTILQGVLDVLATAQAAMAQALKDAALLQTELILDKLSKMNVLAKIVFVLAAGVPLVLLFGTAFHLMTGTPMQPALQRFYLLIFRMPGMSVINDKSLSAALLVNIGYFVGMYSYAIFLGVVTDEVKTTFKSIKGGVLPVRETGHTVLLNWNKYTPLVLQTLARAKQADPDNSFFQRPVTVLAEKPKAEMDAVIKALDLNVHVRSGNPVVAKDLLKVAAHKASTILVLQQEGKQDPADGPPDFNAQAQVAATAMALSSLSVVHGAEPRLVVHNAGGRQHHQAGFLDSVRKLPVYHRDGSLQVAKLSRHAMAQRFQALSAMQPGIVKIYSEILSPFGATLHTMALPEALEGATYREVRKSFDQVVICGFIRDGEVQLLPTESETLKQSSDTLVFLSRSSKPPNPDLSARDVYASVKAPSTKGKASRAASAPPKVLVVAMSARPVADLSENFAQFAVPGTVVTFMLPASSAKAAQALQLPSGPCKFNLQFAHDNNPASVKALCDAGIKDADSVVIAGFASSELPLAEADHCTMAVMLQVQEAVRVSGRAKAPHVVARVRNNATAVAISDFLKSLEKTAPPADLATVIHRPDVLQMEQLIGAALAQSASSRWYLPLMEHLLASSSGAEVYLRDPGVYGLNTDGPASFAEVSEYARQYNETVLGYHTESGRLVLAPELAHEVPMHKCKLVVFAAEYNLTKPKSA